MIYLDYQATTPLAPEAFDAMLPWLRDQHANPHSSHPAGRKAKATVDFARDQIAALLPADGRVAFTSGATEALNWAIKGVTGSIVTLATEHAAVLDTVEALRRGERGGGAGRSVTILPVGHDGLVDLDAARAAIVPGTGLVAAMLVNNEIGVVQPIAALAEIAHEAGALFLCDAVQGFGRVAIPDGCDLVAVSAHKIYGPKGVGALWVRNGVSIEPLLHGGGQEALGRSGTLSPALCAGFGVAARSMLELGASDAAHVAALWGLAVEAFNLHLPRHPGLVSGASAPHSPAPLEAWTPERARGGRGNAGDGWHVNGSTAHRYFGNFNLRHDGLDVARLMSDLRDIAFSAGSACASGSGRSSHVLRAIGLSESQARSSIRLGFGRYTTQAELADALERITTAAAAQHTTGEIAA